MNARRLLFAHAQRPPGITPLGAALALATLVAVIGLSVALWPRVALAHPTHLPVAAPAAAAAAAPPCSLERGLELPATAAPANRSRWM